ncbi:MAG: C1 family peptidase [Bacilli bacterium]|nr:C1 family peptidase [Bacilli bacterium]
MENTIGALNLEALRKNYEADSKNTLVRHSLSRNPVSSVVYESGSVIPLSNNFSISVKTSSVCNQKASGRCWIFAGLNVLREVVAKKLGISRFEFSQNYISLYDKIEKANFALESFITLADKDHDDRVVAHLLTDPVGDGGQWDMFVNLVNKYGLMPKDAFPETYQSNNTRETDILVNREIRHFAYLAHKLYEEGKTGEIRPLKNRTMQRFYNLYLNSFGVPPTTFDFQYEDKDGKYQIERGMTAKSFFEKYIGDEINQYQSLINSPTKDKPFMKNFTIAFLGNVIEGKEINHLNLPMERIKELIIAQLEAGEPVWFGSDVGFYRDRDSFAWDDNAFDYVSSFGFDAEFEKDGMLDYKSSAMNHAMVITGVDIVDGKPTKWKIENSWGGENGLSGYYIMSDTWFSKFVYQAVIFNKYLSEEEKQAASEKPTILSPWDPMGTLAD